MITVTKQFSGLNNRTEPHLLGPDTAQDLYNVNLDSKAIKPQKGLGVVVDATPATTWRSIYKFNSVWLKSTDKRQYAEYSGKLYYAAPGVVPQKTADGTTFYRLGIEAPTSVPTLAAGAVGNPNGTYQHYVTYVGVFGSESAPSSVSSSVTVANQQINLSSIPVSADPQVTKRRIWRSGGNAEGILLVGEIADNTTTNFTDNVADTNLGAALTTSGYGVPGNLEGLVITSYGVMFGWIGNTLYYSEAALPDAWPATNSIIFTEDIVAVVPHSGIVLVLTTSAPYILLGNSSSTFRIVNSLSQQGCLGRDTAVDMGKMVVYRSPDGIVAFSGNDTEVISKTSLSDTFMNTVAHTNACAARFNERYVHFHPDSATPGNLEYNQSVNPPWLKGSVDANAVHYNRSEDKLYVAVGGDIYEWESGSDLTILYRTGDWSDGPVSVVKHHKFVYVRHSGAITVTAYIDGVAHGDPVAYDNGADVLTSVHLLPMGGFGSRLSVKVEGTGTVTEILAGITPMTKEHLDGAKE